MTHDEALPLLTDYAAGRLSDTQRREISRHIDSCSECGGLVETVLVLSDPSRKVKLDRGPPPHPDSAEIVEFALEPESVPGPKRAALAVHVRACERCTHEVESLVQAERSAAPAPAPAPVLARAAAPRRSPSARKSWPRLALAAAAAAGVAGTTYLGVYRLPRLQSRIEGLEAAQRQAAAPGPIAERAPAGSATDRAAARPATGAFARIHVLPMPRRGTVDRPLGVGLHDGEDTLFLSVEAKPIAAASGRRRRFELTDADRAVVWSMETTTDHVASLQASSPELVLSVPAETLPSGRLNFRVLDPEDSSAPLLDIPFDLERPHRD